MALLKDLFGWEGPLTADLRRKEETHQENLKQSKFNRRQVRIENAMELAEKRGGFNTPDGRDTYATKVVPLLRGMDPSERMALMQSIRTQGPLPTEQRAAETHKTQQQDAWTRNIRDLQGMRKTEAEAPYWKENAANAARLGDLGVTKQEQGVARESVEQQFLPEKMRQEQKERQARLDAMTAPPPKGMVPGSHTRSSTGQSATTYYSGDYLSPRDRYILSQAAQIRRQLADMTLFEETLTEEQKVILERADEILNVSQEPKEKQQETQGAKNVSNSNAPDAVTGAARNVSQTFDANLGTTSRNVSTPVNNRARTFISPDNLGKATAAFKNPWTDSAEKTPRGTDWGQNLNTQIPEGTTTEQLVGGRQVYRAPATPDTAPSLQMQPDTDKGRAQVSQAQGIIEAYRKTNPASTLYATTVYRYPKTVEYLIQAAESGNETMKKHILKSMEDGIPDATIARALEATKAPVPFL